MNPLVDIIKLSRQMRDVLRKIHATIGEERRENIGEHSYQLALTSWYLANQEKLKLDFEKMFKYCLVHDMVEVYADDTNAHDIKGLETKKEREEKAYEQLKERFKDSFPEMVTMIQDYEDRKDEESKFIYAVDKILPLLNAYIDPRFWNEIQIGVGPKKAFGYTGPKATSHPVIAKYYKEIKEALLKEKDKYFREGLE